MKKICNIKKPLIQGFLFKLMALSFVFSVTSAFSFSEGVKTQGKIIFSGKEVMLDKAALESSKSNFNLMDDLFVRVFLNEPLSYYYDKYNYEYDFDNKKYTYNYALRIKIDGKEYSKFLDETSEEGFKTVRTIAFPLSTEKTTLKRKYSGLINYWVNIIQDLNPGQHTVEFDLIPYNIDVVGDELPVLASGKFDLTIKSGEMAQFISKNELNLPKPTMRDTEVEEEIVEASKNIIRRAQPVKALITDVTHDWNYTYDENGNILYRHIVASVVYRLTDDNKCIVNSAMYTQKHQGYGDFGPMTFSNETEGYYDYYIPCDVATNERETARTLDAR